MCILCVVQRWSRRVATMLPWLVIPLIIIWALSQLLPPNLRFEITSPRLACVLVLLVTLFWYEVLMPQLSSWRARRSARLREQRRTQALELQKRKKSATRRCRNCSTPYRDQNPGGGKFMCSYCGHISKRPVLELPPWEEWLNGKHSGESRCLTEKSYSGVLIFGRGLVGSLFFNVRWVWEKVFRIGLRDGGSLNGESKGGLSKGGENESSFQESRGEKARRKAEEKRQARLEREMSEEEERKQREEVARLVEERRRLRDEMLEAEKPRSKGSSSVDGERESRKETERRRERKREKDKGSYRSNSDGEELEKRASRESEKKREFDKKSEIERQKALVENFKLQVLDGGNGSKVAVGKSRYFDRMRGTFLSSSRGFNGASFFGRNAQAATPLNKVSKPAFGLVDHMQNLGSRKESKDAHSAGNVIGKSTPNGDHQPVGSNVQPQLTTPKKSWHQLFTRSSTISPDSDTNTMKRQNGRLEDKSDTDLKVFPSYSVDNQFSLGQSLSQNDYFSPVNSSSNGNCMFPPLKEPTRNSVLEDAEPFEDPCYVPNPLALLGPISDSLDKLPLDLGSGSIGKTKEDGHHILKKATASVEVSKPSPIESPLSRLRVSEERQVPCTPKSPMLNTMNLDESTDAYGPGTWQMWGTPLPRDEFGIASGPSTNWFSPLIQTNCNGENVALPLAHNPMISQLAKECPPSTLTHKQASVGNFQNGGRFSSLGPALNGNNPWLQNYPFPSILPVDGENNGLPPYLIANSVQNGVTYTTPHSPAAVYPFEVSPANGWSKEEWELHGRKQIQNSTSPVKPPNIGSLFSTGPDVQSVWSFNHQ